MQVSKSITWDTVLHKVVYNVLHANLHSRIQVCVYTALHKVVYNVLHNHLYSRLQFCMVYALQILPTSTFNKEKALVLIVAPSNNRQFFEKINLIILTS
jgi:hypothetical protein